MGREIQEQKFIYLHIYNIVEKKSKLGEQVTNQHNFHIAVQLFKDIIHKKILVLREEH